MTHNLGNIINYYKDCYALDLRGFSVRNIFDKNVTHLHHPDTKEFLSLKSYHLPVDDEWGKELEEQLFLYSKEKELYTAVFYLRGSTIILGKKQKVYCPLFLYPTELLKENDIFLVLPDFDRTIINPQFYEAINEYLTEPMSFADFQEIMPKGKLNFGNMTILIDTLSRITSGLSLDLLEDWISLTNILSNDKLYRSKSSALNRALIPGVSLGLFKKSTGEIGVLNELGEIQKNYSDSKLLKRLLLGQVSLISPVQQSDSHISPTDLSENQKRIHNTVFHSPATLVIGPPGTGKSYTIASLAATLIGEGKTVLIASKTSQACQVIIDKIEKEFEIKDVVVKAVTKRYKRSITARLNKILNGYRGPKKYNTPLRHIQRELRQLTQKQIDLRASIQRVGKIEIFLGHHYSRPQSGFIHNLKSRWYKLAKMNQPFIWSLGQELHSTTSQKVKKSRFFIKKSHLHHFDKIVKKRRQHFMKLIQILESDSGNTKDRLFSKIDFNSILKAIPIWVCKSSDVHEILPLHAEQFDYLIMDEASQCDIATSIPLIYRVKNAIIVGDPHQLKHISFISNRQESQLRYKYSISAELEDFRKHSILDFVNNRIQSMDQMILLNEHYRSRPQLIEFSNSKFYNNSLEIMTSSSIGLSSRSITEIKIDGIRNEAGVNLEECKWVIHKIKSIINAQINFEASLKHTIGIISPFRAQVTRLKQMLSEEIDTKALKKHNILIGTPYHFQGEERDVIFLSFSLDSSSHPSSFRYLNKEDVFNVSITRARNHQYVVHSLILNQLKDSLLREYLESLNKQKYTSGEIQKTDAFMDEVINTLKKAKINDIYTNIRIAGILVDIVCIRNNKTYCIDLIGYPGYYEKHLTDEMVRILSRLKYPVFFIPYSDWKSNKSYLIAALQKFINT